MTEQPKAWPKRWLLPLTSALQGLRITKRANRHLHQTMQRIQLRDTLVRHWHIPHNIACQLSWYCPGCLLPRLKPELWECVGEDIVTP